jgi:S1-C subfamily serine protease
MCDQLKQFALIAMLLAAACAADRNTFAQEATLTDKARQSIVYVSFDVTNPTTGAKSTIQGTGFIVSKSGYVLTASHLFRDWGKQTDVDRNQNLIRGSLRDKPGNVLESSLILRIVNPGNAEYEDVALLKLPDAVQSFGAASVCMREVTAARVGDNFVAYGFPQDQSFQPVEGTLGTTNAPGGRWAAAAPLTYGMSGGPVYNKHGFVIGLIRGGFPGVPAVNWITPIQHAIGLLQQAGYVDCPPEPPPEPKVPLPRGPNTTIDQSGVNVGRDLNVQPGPGGTGIIGGRDVKVGQ